MQQKKMYERKIKASGSDCNTLKVSIFYDLGGINYFNYKTDKRGYYLSVRPVTIKDEVGWISESFTCFSGTKYFLKEVARQSEKAYQEALKIAKDVEAWLIPEFCKKNNITIQAE